MKPDASSAPATIDLNSLGLLALRLFTGLSISLAHGLGKLRDPDAFATGVAGMGLPLPGAAAWLAILSEFAGGLLIAAGLFTRPAAFMLAGTMTVAAFVAHAGDPFQKRELALFYSIAAVTLLLAGAGRYSLDALIARKAAGHTPDA
jgi:putative oxidoreductase